MVLWIFSWKEDRKVAHPLVEIAKHAVNTYVREGRVVPPKGVFTTPAAAFVSLHRNGSLRGCMGTIEPTKPSVEEEVIANAISAATRDPRFLPVKVTELEDLHYAVDVLSTPEEINSVAMLDPKEYGVIISFGTRKGVLLPDLPGIDRPEKQVEIARQKAGIPENADYRLSRFQVDRYS